LTALNDPVKPEKRDLGFEPGIQSGFRQHSSIEHPSGWASINARMAHRHDDESASITRRDSATVRTDYAAWLAEQPLSSRTREAYLAAVTAFVAWLEQSEAGPGDALLAPRARDLAARDYKRHMKVDRGLSPASVNQALAGMDHLFRFLGLGAAIVRREELPRSAPRALDVQQQRVLLQAAEESTARDRAIVALLLFTGLRFGQGRRLPGGRAQCARAGDARRVGHGAQQDRPGARDAFLRAADWERAVIAIDRARGAPGCRARGSSCRRTSCGTRS
jgi:hypothetical protein